MSDNIDSSWQNRWSMEVLTKDDDSDIVFELCLLPTENTRSFASTALATGDVSKPDFLFDNDESDDGDPSMRWIMGQYEPFKRSLQATHDGDDAVCSMAMLGFDKISSTDKHEMAQRTGLRFQSMMKNQKAYNWTLYEWFYSYIDEPLFTGDDTFHAVILKLFPGLFRGPLIRASWRKLRRLMPKPRRFSQAFVDNERCFLTSSRLKITFIHKTRTKWDYSKDHLYKANMPVKVPVQLGTGTKVTAWLHKPYNCIFDGVVDTYDSTSRLYRVTFARDDLAIGSVPHWDIASYENEELDLQTGLTAVKRVNNRGPESSLRSNDPLHNTNTSEAGSSKINNYPAKWLLTIIRLKRALSFKEATLNRLTAMRIEVMENKYNRRPEDQQEPSDIFKHEYAAKVFILDKINLDIYNYLAELKSYHKILTRPAVPRDTASLLEDFNCISAHEVQRHNEQPKDESLIKLVKALGNLVQCHMEIVKTNYGKQAVNAFELCKREVRSLLFDGNVALFDTEVQMLNGLLRL